MLRAIPKPPWLCPSVRSKAGPVQFDDDGVETAIRYEIYASPGSRGWLDVFVVDENNETAASLRMKEDCFGLTVCLANLVYNLVLIDLTEHTNYSSRVNL